MTYQEQLEAKNWKDKRLEILIRDGYKCQSCFNHNYITEMDAGFFDDFCFPNNFEAIKIDGFGDEKHVRAGINPEYASLLDGLSIVYSKQIPKWRRMVLGVRSLTKMEIGVFNEYEAQIGTFGLEWDRSLLNSHDRLMSAIRSVIEVKRNRIEHFAELHKQNDPLDFGWKFMLGLHIHHKYYVNGILAWNYSNDALVTLCSSCHETLHKNNRIPVYNDMMELLGQYTYCYRCHGAGIFPEYHHVQNGICFRCSGARYEELIGK